MGCMGDPDVKAPNLDKLASKGLPFPKIVEYRFDGVLCGTGIDLTRERSSQRDAISGVPTTPMNKTASVASAAFAWNGYFSPPRRSPPPAQMAEQD